jgi:uncharacterized protein
LRQQADYVWMPADMHIGPTDPRTRIESVDMVRGFALLGVLLVNMYNFGAYSTEWNGIFDRISFTVMHSVFETKSWRLFSFLFGFGFALQMLKLETQTAGSLGFYFRRLVILLFIGMAHSLFYVGDILTQFAVLGIVLLLFRKLDTHFLLILVVLLLAVFPIGNAMVSTDQGMQELSTQAEPTLAERREGHPYLGTVSDVIKENATVVLQKIWRNPLGPESSLARFAMLLLGLYVGRRRILHDIPRHLHLIRRVLHWGLGIGITSAVTEWLLGYHFGYAVFRENVAPIGVQLIGDTLFAYGSTALALGYAAGIVLLAHEQNWTSVLKPLENLGKMALTVYLSGTLMFTTLFYGYGFGQFNLIGPAGVTAYALLFFSVQLVFCAWWLQRFRFGPMEWIWRSLTYWKIQPLRNTDK